MTSRLLPNRQNLWDRHVSMVQQVMVGALIRLREREDLPEIESEIDKSFYFDARNECFERNRNQQFLDFNLSQKSTNAPLNESDLDEDFLDKIPDFTWRMHNNLATSPESMTLDLHIECKRLGENIKSNCFNKNYVAKGIFRFIEKKHRYGHGVADGIMIGYIQSMKSNDIADAVNEYISESNKEEIRPVTFDSQELEKNVMVHIQPVNRVEFEPNNFQLRHIWVNLCKS